MDQHYHEDGQNYEKFDQAEDEEHDKDNHEASILLTAPVRVLREVKHGTVHLPRELAQLLHAREASEKALPAPGNVVPVAVVIHAFSHLQLQRLDNQEKELAAEPLSQRNTAIFVFREENEKDDEDVQVDVALALGPL